MLRVGSSQGDAAWSLNIYGRLLEQSDCSLPLCCCLISSPQTRVFRRILVCSPPLYMYLNAYPARTHVLSRLGISLSSHVHVCATAPSTSAASRRLVRTKHPTLLLRSHPPPSTSHLPRHPSLPSLPHVTQSFHSNRAVGLPHCHTRRHPEPPAHQSPRPISPDWPASSYAQLALQRARLADRILLRPTVPGSRSARLPSGGLHDILLPLDFVRTTSLAGKLC